MEVTLRPHIHGQAILRDGDAESERARTSNRLALVQQDSCGLVIAPEPGKVSVPKERPGTGSRRGVPRDPQGPTQPSLSFPKVAAEHAEHPQGRRQTLGPLG